METNETKTTTEAVDPWVRDEKLDAMRAWIEGGKTPPKEDLLFALDEIKRLDSKVYKAEKALEDLKGAAAKIVSSNQNAKNALTLWLAMRGSNGEDFFKATAKLAAQTVRALNE